MNFYDLPYENLFYILCNLSPRQLINVGHTSHYGLIICKDEYLWKQLIYDKYGVKEKIYEKSWYHNYIDITLMFKCQQLEIILMLKRISPQLFKLLKQLHNYTSLEYNGTQIPLEYVYVSTHEYIESNTE